MARSLALCGMVSLAACVLPPAEPPESPWEITLQPPDGARAVPVRGEIVVSLDRRVFPQSLRADSLEVRSGESVAIVSLSYDPVERSIHALPRFPLLTHAAYRVTLSDLLDLDGNPQPQPFVSWFTTATAAADEGAPPPRPKVPFREIAPVLRGRCARGGCHRGPDAQAGLDLSTGAAVERTALGVPSRGGAAGSGVPPAPRRVHTLAGLPIVDRIGGRGQPGTSYLLYKLLGDPQVLGQPMPLGEPPLASADLRRIRDWIWSGADTGESPSEVAQPDP